MQTQPNVIRVTTDELRAATLWYSNVIKPNDRYAIAKAMRSCDALGVDGNQVLIASYRAYNRMMAHTVPARD